MKYLLKFFAVTLFLSICTQLSAEQKIAFIDMKYVLNKSKAGAGAQDFLQKAFKDSQKKFIEEEKKLKKEESDLLSKRGDLTKEEYMEKTNDLRKKVVDYQEKRRTILDKISIQRSDAREQLLKELDPILASYVKDNAISIIIDKKIVFIGNADLDITLPIVEILNKIFPKLILK